MGLSALGETVAVIGAVTVLVVISTVAVGTTLAVRGVRRRYRRVRSRFASPDAGPGSRLPAVRATAVATVGSPTWWVAQRDRHRMWRAVSSAQHAVSVAQQAGAPVGDLPTLSRQLSVAAHGLDAVLRAGARSGAARRETTAERHRLESAAAALEGAALDSLRTVASVDVEPVLSQVRLEVAALGAGLRASGHVS